MRALLAVCLLAAICATVSSAAGVKFVLPYDLVVAPTGTIYFTDRSRIMRVEPKTGQVRLHRGVPGAKELVGLARLADGTLLTADLPSGKPSARSKRIWYPNVLTVPTPVRSDFGTPFAKTWRTKSSYWAMARR